jgi:DHA2 family multidrug resistance protein-like MFS transporter
MPASMDAALGALSAERSGVGSALLMAMRQVGGTIGVAVLGTVLASTYRGSLDLTGVPAPLSDAVRDSASAGVVVAQRLASEPLLSSVRAAFVDGMDAMLWVCGGAAVAGVVLALAFLPRRARVASPSADAGESVHGLAA